MLLTLMTAGRMGARRVLVSLVLAFAMLYAGAVGYLASQETRLVFAHGRPLGEGRPAAPFEPVPLAGAGGSQFGWVMRQPEDPDATWLLYLHGNRATVASRTNLLRYDGFRAAGLNILAPEYRGFGGVPGTPTEDGLSEDARAGYDYLRRTLNIAPERIVIFGWSLGSAVAVNLASQVESAGVILEGAPASLVAIGERDYPWMPVRLVMRNRFESILKVDRIRAPMLFLHSPEDEVIPFEEGRRLFDAAPEPKTFVEVRGGHIRPAEEDRQKYFASVSLFLARLRSSSEAIRPY
jgi:fermentation-respiration switch protein FrsA (DUF1100 family)